MLEKQSNVKAWLYLLPALALLSVFTFYPLFNAFLLAFLKDYVYGNATGFVFMDNFKNVIADPNFNQAVKNTSIIVFVSVPISVTVALMISVLLNSIKKFQGVLQTIFFLPYVTNAIAIGMAFAFIFNESYGLLNLMLSWVGLGAVDWLGSWETGMVSLLIYTVWGGLAFKIMVFLSGLQSIDKQYYDAARVDATPKFRVFTRITVPLLSPMIAYITITSFIGSFKAYRTIVGLFGPTVLPAGTLPDESFITIVGLIYESLSKSDTPGMVSEAAAASILLFITTLTFTIVNMWVSKKRVHF